MSINTQLIKGINQIDGHGSLEEFSDNDFIQHFEQPMDDVVVRTLYSAPPKSVEFPFRKSAGNCLEFTYILSGDTILSLRNGPGDWTDYHISEAVRTVGYNTEFGGIAMVNSSVPINNFHVYITPQKLAQLLGSGNEHLVRTIIDETSLGKHSSINNTNIDPITSSIIHQISTRKGSSPADSLFLRGKILELLAHEVELLCSPRRKETILQPEDIIRLQTARSIMMELMSTPPHIAELARRVGLNEKKIKQGFKELYGTTVYGFLRDYRMEQAKLMFDRDHKSVTEVACTVGYSNVSHFGVLFKQHHGVQPGEYLRSLKEQLLTHQLSS